MFRFVERVLMGVESYEDALDRIRARALGWISLALVPIAVALSLLFAQPAMRLGVLAVVGVGVLILVLVRVRALDAAVVIFVILLSIVVDSIVFLQPLQDNEVFIVAALQLFVLAISSLVSNTSAPAVGGLGIGFAAIILQYLIKARPAGDSAFFQPVDYLVSAFVLGIGGTVLVQVSRRNRAALATARAAAAEERRRSQVYAGVLADARRGLDAGEGLTGSAERTSRLVDEIVGSNRVVDDRLGALQAE
ncbi:MAG TPA: hypothetical protein PKW82_06015, partial [Spirochaetales bacterium]|nr:hypothetical protein [Spirochaetales bacterium]